jgi:hypothetical protein
VGVNVQRSSKPGPLPSPKASTAREPEDEQELELELEDVSGEPPPALKPRPTVRSAARAKPGPARKRGGAASPFALDAAGLRGLLAEQPEVLEAGLAILRDDDGNSVGASYRTPVGEIDLLATDAEGDFVVITILDKDHGEELVAEVLKRLGWVRKHLGEGEGKKVRGIVLCDEPPESLSYTAAAVADTVAFKTYKVALSFEDLEL